MKKNWSYRIALCAAALSAVAAFFGLWASINPPPDDIDTLVGALQRANELSRYGAICAAASAVLFVIAALVGRGHD